VRRYLFILLILVLPLRSWAGPGLDQHCTVPCQEISGSAAHAHIDASAVVQHDDCKSDLCCFSMALDVQAATPIFAMSPAALPTFTLSKIVSAVIAHDVKPPIS
jgi:hypothetical protein